MNRYQLKPKKNNNSNKRNRGARTGRASSIQIRPGYFDERWDRLKQLVNENLKEEDPDTKLTADKLIQSIKERDQKMEFNKKDPFGNKKKRKESKRKSSMSFLPTQEELDAYGKERETSEIEKEIERKIQRMEEDERLAKGELSELEKKKLKLKKLTENKKESD